MGNQSTHSRKHVQCTDGTRDLKSKMVDQGRAKLLRHAEEVCKTVFGTDALARLRIEAFTAQDSSLSMPISQTHEFMIFMDLSQAPYSSLEAREKLGSFLGKHV
jgi:hypothetical protein